MTDRCIVYHGLGRAPRELSESAHTPREPSIEWRPASELFAAHPVGGDAIVLLADAAMFTPTLASRDLPSHVVVLAMDDASDAAAGERVDVSIAGVRDGDCRARLFGVACRLAVARSAFVDMNAQLKQTDHEFRELSRIGMGLMLEREREALLHLILQQAKQLTESDGGGLLLIDSDERPARVRPGLYEIDSLPDLDIPLFNRPLDSETVIGHAALTKEPIVLADAHDLPPGADFTTNGEFERRHGYHVQSMMVVPMIDHLDHVLGVLVLINRKSDRTATIRTKEDAARYVVPYSDREVRLARSLASQAAVSIENARLYAQIERILESFVKASVTAIEQRDPTTLGHSIRVAALTTRLARVLERAGSGRYRGVRFTAKEMRELRFAALLHDFGKLSVREDVLIKAKKLPPVLTERVMARFDLIRRTLEMSYYKQRSELGRDGAGGLDVAFAQQIAELERQRQLVRAANEPTVLDRPVSDELVRVAACTFRGPSDIDVPYLTADELHYLQIAQGTLDEGERAEIESHVSETYQFLARIPWTQDLENLAAYAYEHHEKLDGSGYPRRLKGDDIPLQARLIATADIFDALTASDRPYKAAVSPDEALSILQSEANKGLLDHALVTVLTESQIYRGIVGADWHAL